MSEDQAPYSTPHITAGPELDALIAEKVMGWRDGKHPEHVFLNSGWGNSYTFSPSTSLDDAFMVIERLRKLDPALHGFRVEYREGVWFTGFIEKGLYDYQFGDVYALHLHQSLPLAICLVALAWVKATAPEAGPPAR